MTKKLQTANEFDKFIEENAMQADSTGWNDGEGETVVVFGPDVDADAIYSNENK